MPELNPEANHLCAPGGLARANRENRQALVFRPFLAFIPATLSARSTLPQVKLERAARWGRRTSREPAAAFRFLVGSPAREAITMKRKALCIESSLKECEERV
jgi:hypothetical protein